MITMNTKILAAVITLSILVLVAIGIFAFNGHHTTQATTTYNNNLTSNSSKTLFSSTQYFPYSYQIYPGPTSQQAQLALSGFNITSAIQQNSSAKITLTLLGTSQSQSIILKPNYKLYIVETTFGDDGFHYDSSLGDDGFIMVDSNGYITQ